MKITIASRDTARAVGLRALLLDYFDIEAHVAMNPVSLPIFDDGDTPATVYIVDAEIFCAYADFFIPRRQRTLTIGHGPAMLCVECSEGDLVERLRNFVDSMSAVAVDTPLPLLSQREIDVLRLVATGHINKEIADILGITLNTVLTHRKNITAKLGIRSASGLGVYAMMHGYITP